MTEINDLRKQGIQTQVFACCSDCGKPRWVRVQKGKPRNSRCQKCQTKVAQKANQDKVIRQDNPADPSIGTIRRGRDINKTNPCNKYMWCACESCGDARWVMLVKGNPITHICTKCQLKERMDKAHAKPHLTGDKHPMWKGGEIDRTCQHCGGQFKTQRCLVRKGYGKYCSRSCTAIAMIKDGRFDRRPTKPENKLLDIITRHNLPFRYTGDGQFWIGRCNPDFIHVKKTRKVIEVFGVYWHDVFDVSRRIEAFHRHKFECLVLWEDELLNEKKVVAKIKQFTKAS